MKHLILPLIIATLGLMIVPAQIARAGGGQYRPITFSHQEVIKGRSVNIEVEIQKDNFSGPASGEDFEIEAHHDLPGASCQTTQRTADSQGRIKGSCKADGNGRFVFQIKPVSKISVQSGVTFEVFFAQESTATGFQDQGSKSTDNYEAIIVQNPSSVTKGERFTVEVKLKRDGQITGDDAKVQSARWQVLKGGMVTYSSEDGSNRKLSVSVDDSSTVIKADVTLTSGEQLFTSSKAIQLKAEPKATSNPTTLPKPTASPKLAPSPLPVKPTTASVSADKNVELEVISASDTAEIMPQNQEENHIDEVKKAEPWWKRLRNWLFFWR